MMNNAKISETVYGSCEGYLRVHTLPRWRTLRDIRIEEHIFAGALCRREGDHPNILHRESPSTKQNSPSQALTNLKHLLGIWALRMSIIYLGLEE